MVELLPYFTLFGTAFIAATVFPAASEAVLAGLLLSGTNSVAGLFLAAWMGNTLGSVSTWAIGRGAAETPWVAKQREGRGYQRAEALFTRFGQWSLLLAWAPLFGDALCLVAGLLRLPLGRFVVLVGIGKALRYIAVIALTLGLFG